MTEEEKTELEYLIDNHNRLTVVTKELRKLEGQRTQLVHSLICNQDLPEFSIVRYKGRTYYLIADVVEFDSITITEVADLNRDGKRSKVNE